MGKITEIKGGKRQGKRVDIFVNGRFAMALDTEIAVKEKLKVDTELEPDRIKELLKTDEIQRCLDVAVRFLSYRPRSEMELRERLQRRGFSSDVIDGVVNKLKEQGLVDDNAFATFWTENRESFSPRSQYLTRRELKQKGVAEDVIEQLVSSIDDKDSAYRTALIKTRRLSTLDYQDFRKRLGGYLRRRGFNFETINQTIEKIWRERGSPDFT